MKWWPPFRHEPHPAPITPASAARELGRLGGQAIGRRRHMEAEARHHAEHERMKAMARRMRADCHMKPAPILEPADFNEEA